MAKTRGHWASKAGFVLAAAGSAVGLGNIWKFPYVTGENGGGAFVLIYLACVTLVGLPVMLGEVLIGRMSQSSPVGAFTQLSDGRRSWRLLGSISVVTAIVILSYYSVVAGWGLHYLWLSISGALSSGPRDELPLVFERLAGDGRLNLLWHSVFMLLTYLVVRGGVQRGVERAARIMMPALFLMLTVLVVYAMTLKGFAPALDFVFGFHTDKLSPASVLEALGHSFFTLSVGMGAMLTYGSYMKESDDIVGTSIAITTLDTLVSLMACLVLFPVTFSFGMEAAAGPGLVFINIPMALSQLPGTGAWASLFFLLLTFAALSSAISLLEVGAAYWIDERGWSRDRAVAMLAVLIYVFGIPSALSQGDTWFGAGMTGFLGRSWFDTCDYLASNWLLPLGGLSISGLIAFRVERQARAASFALGSRWGRARWFYLTWLRLIQVVVPIAIVLVMLHALGVI